MSEHPPQSPPARAVYIPVWWAWIAAAAAGGFVYWRLGAYPAFLSAAAVPRFALVAGGFAAALVVAQALWWLSSRRPAYFHPVFLGTAAVVWTGALIWAREVQVARDAEVAERVASARRELERSARSGTVGTARRDAFLPPEDRFLRYEGQIAREDIRALQELDREMLGGLRRANERLDEVSEPVRNDHPDLWLTAETRSDLRARREAYVRVYEATRTIVDLLDTFAERYEARLAGMNLGERGRRVSLAEVERILQDREFVAALHLRTLEADAIEMLMRALEILENNWGAWRFNKDLGRLTFDRPQVEDAFFHALAEAEASLARIRESIDERSR
ncbi:MAG: hypothetical protein JJU00_02775 [Opitutales bacterium]|nr:hypothetical protein [Opitutales bacterium]